MEVIVLTEVGAKLYGALYDQNDWMSTKQLAEVLGKKQLNPNDRKQLEGMVEKGYVDKQVVQSGGFGQNAFLYRCL